MSSLSELPSRVSKEAGEPAGAGLGNVAACPILTECHIMWGMKYDQAPRDWGTGASYLKKDIGWMGKGGPEVSAL